MEDWIVSLWNWILPNLVEILRISHSFQIGDVKKRDFIREYRRGTPKTSPVPANLLKGFQELTDIVDLYLQRKKGWTRGIPTFINIGEWRRSLLESLPRPRGGCSSSAEWVTSSIICIILNKEALSFNQSSPWQLKRKEVSKSPAQQCPWLQLRKLFQVNRRVPPFPYFLSLR